MFRKIDHLKILLTTFFICSCMSHPIEIPNNISPENNDKMGKNEKEIKEKVNNETIEINKVEKPEEINKSDNLELQYKDHDLRILAIENTIKKLNFQINDLSQDNNVSKKIITLLKNDVNSLNEQIATNRKEIEIIKRGLRSGIFEDQTSFDKQPPGSLGTTMLPDMLENRDIYTDKSNSSIVPLQSATATSNEPIGPAQLIAEAEIKIRQAQYGEAIISLNNMKKNYPNYNDKGKSLLLSSEAWLRLGEYNNVFGELRTFYIKYPNNPDLSYAKLLEGETYEKLNSKSKASQLYQEVITLSPESMDAQNARDGMIRMRDTK
jgi:TolA-binding protein